LCFTISIAACLSLYISTSAGSTKWRRYVVKPLEKPTAQVYYALQYTAIEYSWWLPTILWDSRRSPTFRFSGQLQHTLAVWIDPV